MSTRTRRKRVTTVVAIIVIALIAFAIFRYSVAPTLHATMIQHTFGNDISISISGIGTLVRGEVSAYIFSGGTTIRIFIVNVVIEEMDYRESFPYSASATLPTMSLPKTVLVQTFYDTGDFQFLRTHQNVAVRVVIEGVWSLGSMNFGPNHLSTEICCVQPF